MSTHLLTHHMERCFPLIPLMDTQHNKKPSVGAPRTHLSRLSGGNPRRVPQGSSHYDGRIGGAHGWAVHAAMCVKSCQRGRVRWAGKKSSEGDASCATTTQRIATGTSAEERPARALPALRAARRGREEMTKYGDVKNTLI